MTVADLIRELQAMPNQHARVDMVIRTVYDMHDGLINVSDEEALEADEVRCMGPFVLIRSK